MVATCDVRSPHSSRAVRCSSVLTARSASVRLRSEAWLSVATMRPLRLAELGHGATGLVMAAPPSMYAVPRAVVRRRHWRARVDGACCLQPDPRGQPWPVAALAIYERIQPGSGRLQAGMGPANRLGCSRFSHTARLSVDCSTHYAPYDAARSAGAPALTTPRLGGIACPGPTPSPPVSGRALSWP